ncbi:hypothetical protein KEJ45_05105 [Candidatus Bathyarchaeota archaeon]|nr:hypothetical protein [Candidatus Bathyarchaeota archaeon]
MFPKYVEVLVGSLDEHYGFILLSDEKWWNRLCERGRNGNSTHAFVRRSLVGPVEAQKLLFYVKRPSMQIKGVADFLERVAGDYKELWSKYGDETCLKSFDDYLQFLNGRQKVTFVRFTNFCELDVPVSMKTIKQVLGVSIIPRGGKYISREVLNQLLV